MRIVCVDGKDIGGVGGALRGREMAAALASLGHDARLTTPDLTSDDPIARLRPLDAMIYTGTWHQLIGAGQALVRVTEQCEAEGIPPIWWYGSNGSVFGCVDADPRKRADAEKRVIATIAERRFIGVICPYSIDIYQRHGLPREKMRLIPSVFDGDLFTPAVTPWDKLVTRRLRNDFGVPQAAFCLGTIGNTPNSKGGDDVLRAMALLVHEMPDLHYTILHTPEHSLNRVKAKSPDGLREGNSEWDVLQLSKKLARDLGIADRVHFIGMRLKREAMPLFYRTLNVYCSPSKAENLGQPLVESQLCGLPLVTYKGFSFDFVAAEGLAQQVIPSGTVTDDYGLVIPECRPEDLADAIRRARHVAEQYPTGAYGTNAIRAWTYQKFHHHNASIMTRAIADYREMLHAGR